MVCVSRSRLGRGGLTQFCIKFLRYRTGGQFKLRAVDGPCLEVSLGTWGPDPFLYQFFAIQNRRSFPAGHSRSEKNDPEMGQVSTFRARLRDTDHLRASNLAARTLRFVEHTLSKFGDDPCPVRRRLAAAVKCYVRKARFFLCRQRTEMTQSLPTALLAGFSTMKGNPVLFSVFRSHNSRP